MERRRVKRISPLLLAAAPLLLAAGCSNYSYMERTYYMDMRDGAALRAVRLDPRLEDAALRLDPEHVSGEDVARVLRHLPAPRVFLLHGGAVFADGVMRSFGKFLVEMGYPEGRIRHPWTGEWTRSCYTSAEELAGSVAWAYEREAMRPMIVGHSQGGMQAVKVLHILAGKFDADVPVFSLCHNRFENRAGITDPFTGRPRPVTDCEVCYASAVAAGGLTRLMPNQWDMAFRLRSIPDSVSEFAGYTIRFDPLGNDLMGFGPTNDYEPNGLAKVRNLTLPFANHVFLPDTQRLARNGALRQYLNEYVQSDDPHVLNNGFFLSDKTIWAADVWYSIKKHWVLEAQRLIRARRSLLAQGN
jgi:hypothetical protein